MKAQILQNNFAAGVFEPRLAGRTDIDQYYKALKKGENVVTIPLGGVTRRAGLEYIDKLPNQLVEINASPTMPNGGTPGDINDFDYSTFTSTTIAPGTTDPYVIAEYDFGANQNVLYWDIINISLDTGSTTEVVVQESSNGSTWNTIGTIPIIDTNIRSYRIEGTDNRYFRLVRIGATDLGSSVFTLSGFWSYSEGAAGSCRIIDFGVSDQDLFLVVLTDRTIIIYENDAIHTILPSKFDEASLQTMDAARTDYVMLMVQEDVVPQRLIYDTFDDLFLIDDVPFSSIPVFDYNDSLSPTPVQAVYDYSFSGLNNGQLFRLRLEGFETEEIVYEGAGTVSTADGIRRALEALPIVGAGGVSVDNTTQKITFSDSSTDNFEIFTGYVTTGDASDTVTISVDVTGSPRKEDVWSEIRGYPRTIAFYQNRLWFGGTKSKPQSLFGSRTNAFFDFKVDIGLPADPIFVSLNSKRRNSITSIVSSRRLAIFTDGSEFVTNEGANTPEDITIDSQTSYGSSFVRPVDVEGNIIFIDRNSSTLRGFLFDFGEDGFSSQNLSLLSSHLIKSPVDMSFGVGIGGDDTIYVFIINEDGTAAVYNTLRTQGISNFTEMTTEGDFVSCEGLANDMYFGVSRTLDSVDGIYLEKWNEELYTDSSVLQTFGAPTDTITGLDHLNGVECRVVADGSIMDNATPVGGEITLVREASVVEVGINYNCTIQMMPLAPVTGAGNGLMHKKKIARQHFNVYETYRGWSVDGRVIPSKDFGEGPSDTPLGTPPAPFTGYIRNIEGQEGWESLLAPLLEFPDPLPFTILAIESEVEVS